MFGTVATGIEGEDQFVGSNTFEHGLHPREERGDAALFVVYGDDYGDGDGIRHQAPGTACYDAGVVGDGDRPCQIATVPRKKAFDRSCWMALETSVESVA